jgi:hypothetical protein
MANRNEVGRRVATAEHCLVAHPRTGVTPDLPFRAQLAINDLEQCRRLTARATTQFTSTSRDRF